MRKRCRLIEHLFRPRQSVPVLFASGRMTPAGENAIMAAFIVMANRRPGINEMPSICANRMSGAQIHLARSYLSAPSRAGDDIGQYAIHSKNRCLIIFDGCVG